MKPQYLVVFMLGALVLMSGFARGQDAPAVALTDVQKAALHKTIETCGTCHGINGRSVSPTFPNLAAQTAPYIELQL
ncbi:MAG: c-type cytochrome, partial [Steroidobacteraceae bacterium]